MVMEVQIAVIFLLRTYTSLSLILNTFQAIQDKPSLKEWEKLKLNLSNKLNLSIYKKNNLIEVDHVQLSFSWLGMTAT